MKLKCAGWFWAFLFSFLGASLLRPSWANEALMAQQEPLLADKIAKIHTSLSTPHWLDSTSCAHRLASVFSELEAIVPSREIIKELGDRVGPTIRNLFVSRLELQTRLLELHQKGGLLQECADEARNLMRALRFGEEYLAEAWLKPPEFNPKKPAPYLAGKFPNLQSASLDSPFDVTQLRSGDLLLSRGNAIASAAIARMADVNGQFSHLAQIYIEPETGSLWVLEAHIEVGTTVRSFEKYAADLNPRVMVLRAREPRDQHLAARAAAIQFRRLKEARDRGGSVPYDFSMRLEDSSELFCSELVYEGFQKAAGQGDFVIPLFQSRITPKNRDFLNRIGISVSQTFLPSDLEVDPRFEVLAEWRDLSRVANLRRIDAVLDRFYDWSEVHGYRLTRRNIGSWLKKTVIWRLRRWPGFSELLKDRFPLNMSPSTIEAVSVLMAFGQSLLEKAQELDAQALAQRGVSLSFTELNRGLDALRETDLENYWAFQRAQSGHFERPAFTQYFHP